MFAGRGDLGAMSPIGGWRAHARERMTHTALFYAGEQEYLNGVRKFIGDAGETDSPVVIAVPGPGLERLRDGLDGDLNGAQLADMTELGANPARIIPAIRAASDEQPGRTLYIVEEPVWPDRSEAEIGEAMRHEALINRAFTSTRVHILCAYDVTAIGPATIADAERTHRWVADRAGRHASSAYAGTKLPACCQVPLSDPPADAASLRFELADLARARALVSEHAARARLTVGQCGDVVLAVNEIATNSVRHGGGSGTLYSWHEPGRLTCQISDSGRIRDPLAGRVRPDADARQGRGLWMANQLCDLVQIRSGPSGTTVRVHARRHEPDGAAGPKLRGERASSDSTALVS
jgi:anti-sigma regulatory factor (Ser/Thr protein kinase)